MHIRWTQPALDDFKAISYRIEQDRNLDAANRVCRSIYDVIQILRRYPHSGRLPMKEETRELVIPQLPYLIAYRIIEPDAVQILRI